MEKNLVENLQSTLPTMFPLIQREDNLVINYDKGADVLYISFGIPQKADDTELVNGNMLMRKKGKRIVGVTILNFKKSSFA